MAQVLVRIACLVIGYCFGLFQTGYIYGRLHHRDIRKEGSGNSGTTNAFRTMGRAAGVITFVGDALKCVLAIVLVYFLFRRSFGNILAILFLYTGLGCILGHNYPFYMQFKGGKGIAVTAGLIGCTLPLPIGLICLAAFLIAAVSTKYVSVGSLVVVVVYDILVFIYGQTGGYGLTTGGLVELYILVVLVAVSAFYKHRDNIKRLMNGTENKFSIGKEA